LGIFVIFVILVWFLSEYIALASLSLMNFNVWLFEKNDSWSISTMFDQDLKFSNGNE